MSYVDRYLIAVCLQPIKTELQLSDTALGVLTGFAFSGFYALLGLPIAAIADRGRRRPVIALSIVVWSAMTAATAGVHSFAQMAVARFGVGAGEAGVFPTSQAIISGMFPARRRTTALAIFATGGSIGLLLAFAVGSGLEVRYGWRWTFVIMALPGVPLALIAWLTLPIEALGRRGLDLQIAKTLKLLWSERDFRHLPFAQSALVILLFGQAQWLPTFFERSFGVAHIVVGRVLGVSQALATVVGMFVGGVLADRLGRVDSRWPLRLAFMAILAAAIPVCLLYTAHNTTSAFVYAGIASFCLSLPAGPIAAHLQIVFPPSLRASASAGALIMASLFGLGLGPLSIGGLSDFLSPRFGAESLRYGLLITALSAIAWGAAHLDRLIRYPPTLERHAIQS